MATFFLSLLGLLSAVNPTAATISTIKVNLMDEEAEARLGLTNRYRLERRFPAPTAATGAPATRQPREQNDGEPINAAATAAPRQFPSRAFPCSRLKRRRI